MKKTAILAIVEGWGIGPLDESNAIYSAVTPTMKEIQRNYPGGALQASGIAIGLSWETPSSSELGHFIIGSGRVLSDYSKKILAKSDATLEPIKNTLGETLSLSNKTQMRIMEEEKYKSATYFFNGLVTHPFPNEYRVNIPSQNVVTPEMHPEMMAQAITDRALMAIHEETFDFILVNYANLDVIASTGKYEATITAVTTIDNELKRLKTAALEGDHALFITSSHGNAESALNLSTGETEKIPNANPVPLFLVSNSRKLKQPHPELYHLPPLGLISDISPTILEFLGIKIPREMTGESLLSELI